MTFCGETRKLLRGKKTNRLPNSKPGDRWVRILIRGRLAELPGESRGEKLSSKREGGVALNQQ